MSSENLIVFSDSLLDQKKFKTLFEKALCAGKGSKLFFPGKGKNSKLKATKTKKICEQCPVREECLQYAIYNREHFGIWGGVNFSNRLERKKVMKNYRKRPKG